jgi:hypothetical protein
MKNKRVITSLLIFAILMQCLTVVSLAAAPAAPQQFKAQINGSYVEVNWEKVPSGVIYTSIERSTDSGDFQTIATFQAGFNSFKDYGVSNGHLSLPCQKLQRIGLQLLHQRGRDCSSLSISLTATNYYSDQVNLVWTYPSLAGYRTVSKRPWLSAGRMEKAAGKWFMRLPILRPNSGM